MKKLKYIIGIGIIVACIVFLAVRSFKKTGVYYLTVSEVYKKSSSLGAKSFRVDGKIVPGSILWNPEEIILRFNITDGEKTLSVLHKGVKPDVLSDSKEVVIEGTLDEEGVFNAAKLITKCPSKYKPESTK